MASSKNGIKVYKKIKNDLLILKLQSPKYINEKPIIAKKNLNHQYVIPKFWKILENNIYPDSNFEIHPGLLS